MSMKPWDYYRLKTVKRPNRSDFIRRGADEVHAKRMTTAERDKALSELADKANAWFEEAIKPYREEEARLINEFWTDCREELGYAAMFDEAGVAALEQMAWDRGHSSGFEEVYGELTDLVSLAETLLMYAKPTAK